VGAPLRVALLAHLAGSEAPTPRSPRRIALVREYIEANLARPLRLAELASLAGVCERRFGEIFATETGCSPHRYVPQRRIERAKTLLRDPELTLGQIAEAVGFADAAHLCRVFRRHVGATPGAHRPT